jgi:hypothetical protein
MPCSKHSGYPQVFLPDVHSSDTTSHETRKTPCPQKSPSKANAAVNKMKVAATTAPRSPDKSDDPDEPDEAEEEGIEYVVWDHPEAEQKIKSDEIYVDDGATGIQSVMEAAAAVVSFKANKPSPSKRKMPASKAKKPGPPSDDQAFWLRFPELCRDKADHGTKSVPPSKMVHTMYLQLGFIISGIGTQVIYWRINTRLA